MSDALVLVVDDDDELRDLMVFACKQAGFSVHAVEDTRQARQWMERNEPSLVLLDIMMPGGNGLDLCRWIRAEPRFEKVPIIISSAIKDEETAQDALELGAVDFLQKPFEVKVLLEKIQRARARAQ